MPRRKTNLEKKVGQGPIALTVGAVGGSIRHFNSRLSFHFFFFFLLIGCFGLNGPLRRYFSLYRAVSQREGWLVGLLFWV